MNIIMKYVHNILIKREVFLKWKIRAITTRITTTITKITITKKMTKMKKIQMIADRFVALKKLVIFNH